MLSDVKHELIKELINKIKVHDYENATIALKRAVDAKIKERESTLSDKLEEMK